MGLWAWTINQMLTPKFRTLIRREGIKINYFIKDFGKLILECIEHNPDQVIMQAVKMDLYNVLDKINLVINIMRISMLHVLIEMINIYR